MPSKPRRTPKTYGKYVSTVPGTGARELARQWGAFTISPPEPVSDVHRQKTEVRKKSPKRVQSGELDVFPDVSEPATVKDQYPSAAFTVTRTESDISEHIDKAHMANATFAHGIQFPHYLGKLAERIQAEYDFAVARDANREDKAPEELWTDLAVFLKESAETFRESAGLDAPLPVIVNGEDCSLELFWSSESRHINISFWSDRDHVATFVGHDDANEINRISGEFDFSTGGPWILTWLMK